MFALIVRRIVEARRLAASGASRPREVQMKVREVEKDKHKCNGNRDQESCYGTVKSVTWRSGKGLRR